MNFVTANHSDVGIKKDINQDSLMIKQAETESGTVLFACVCDGMGGLAKGEVASSMLIKSLSDWFENDFPQILSNGLKPEDLINSWEALAYDANEDIKAYGEEQDISLGTTCVAFLVVESKYYIMNIGDSRAYLISDNVYQLTLDQTYCQREIDAGRMTPREAEVSPNRSVLLQCVGAIDTVEPDFYSGKVEPNQCFMLCSDGFRHKVSPQEMLDKLNPEAAVDSQVMTDNLICLTEIAKERLETDNITALLIKTI